MAYLEKARAGRIPPGVPNLVSSEREREAALVALTVLRLTQTAFYFQVRKKPMSPPIPPYIRALQAN